MKEKIRMFRDLLLVRRIKSDQDKKLRKDKGLIIELVEETRFAQVLEVGPRVNGISIGDTIVLMGETPGGQDFMFNGELLVVMREKYVFGLMK